MAVIALRRGDMSAASRATLTVVAFVAAVTAAGLVAVLNPAWFDAVNAFVHATDTVPRGLLFSSWLLFLGGGAVVRRPASFGLRLGDVREHLRLIAGVSAIFVVATVGLLRLVGSTPYSDASLFIEVVDVPVTEELVFRAVLLTALLAVLGRLWTPTTAVALAVLIDGFAFGVAHLANAMSIASAFVIGQAIFAVVIGMACAALMVRTRSVYPAVFLHAAVNATVVLAS